MHYNRFDGLNCPALKNLKSTNQKRDASSQSFIGQIMINLDAIVNDHTMQFDKHSRTHFLKLYAVGDVCSACLARGNKIILMGNEKADSQHITLNLFLS